jgi:hypothetical protein
MPQGAAIEPAPRPGPVATIGEIEQAWQRQMEPLLLQVKQVALEVIDDVGRKHGNPLLGQVRQTLVETVGVLLKAELPALLEQLKPAVREGGEAVRHNADSLIADLKQFITTTVVEVFRVHVPEYSRWVGRRMIDYIVATTLFCLAAVLGCVGLILGLERAGLPAYATYLIGGGVAAAAAIALLKLRPRLAEPEVGSGTRSLDRHAKHG